jgi:hypothetical protein
MEATAGESSLESMRAGPGRAEPKLDLSPITFHFSPITLSALPLRLCVFA